MAGDIAVSALVVTKDEAHNLARCLASLGRFAEVLVIDSHSGDGTAEIARSWGVPVIDFHWNGAYPKKRQWCLDTLTLAHERVFFIDADEVATPALGDEIAALDWACDGYFIRGQYVVRGAALRFGIKNNKLCLFDRRKIEFPVVDDLAATGMGEIEGHYQPVFKPGIGGSVGQLKRPVLHYALEDKQRYAERHNNYSVWHKQYLMCNMPNEILRRRQILKKIWRALPAKKLFYFIYFYGWKLGLLECHKNLDLYRQTSKYYTQ